MNLELQTLEIAITEDQSQFQFVIDADLVHVGGGSALADY
jgi:hypothetical protein